MFKIGQNKIMVFRKCTEQQMDYKDSKCQRKYTAGYFEVLLYYDWYSWPK